MYGAKIVGSIETFPRSVDKYLNDESHNIVHTVSSGLSIRILIAPSKLAPLEIPTDKPFLFNICANAILSLSSTAIMLPNTSKFSNSGINSSLMPCNL